MEDKNLFNQIRDLMVKYGFITEEEKVEFNSLKLTDDTIIQLEGELEVEKEVFSIDESGERIPLIDGEFKTESLKFNIEEGKVIEVAERFAEVTTVDGVVLMVEGEVAEGSAVMVVLEEGNEPAPDGEYELEDGVKFTVEEGVIVKVGEEEAPEVPEEDVPEEPEVEPEMSEMNELLDLFKTFIETVSTKMEEMEAKVDNFQSSVDELKESFQSFKKEPDAEPIKNKKTDFDSQGEKIHTIIGMRKNK